MNRKEKGFNPLIPVFGSMAGVVAGLRASSVRPVVYFLVIAGVGLLLGLVLALGQSKKKPQPPKAPEEPVDEEKLQQILSVLRERTKCPAVRIHAEKADDLPLTASKFGGFPYWEDGADYPCTHEGEKLLLLAQINFDEVDTSGTSLPKNGLLQFFVRDDDLCGCDFAPTAVQNTYRVVYHPATDRALSREALREMGISSSTELDYHSSCFPFFGEYALRFERFTDSIGCCVSNYDRIFDEVMTSEFSEPLTEGSVYKHFNSAEWLYLVDAVDSFGHKMLGYPAFTQDDPRCDEEEPASGHDCTLRHYDTLLLQIDSDSDIMWGDSGVCNFFINSANLGRLDFSDVLYTWDCY